MDKMANKRNYQIELDKIIEEKQKLGVKPKLLLHSCCGPCSSYVVTYLMKYFEVTVLYYNPSIYPEEEYQLRLSEQARLLKELDVPLMEVGYDHQSFLNYITGLEGEPEGGGRCVKCFRQRLEKTRELAAEGGFDYFCTTLTVSPHKNAVIINGVGEELEATFVNALEIEVEPSETVRSNDGPGKAAKWLPADFKKKEGYKKSIELSHKYELYRQDYCGCEFSIRK